VKQNQNTPSPHAIRLEDLRAWHVVFATCGACGSRTHVAAKVLEHGRPPHTSLSEIERKLRCSRCGNRRGNTLTLSMAPRG
jgi:hypothetical protein